jgi:hypothetical protein
MQRSAAVMPRRLTIGTDPRCAPRCKSQPTYFVASARRMIDPRGDVGGGTPKRIAQSMAPESRSTAGGCGRAGCKRVGGVATAGVGRPRPFVSRRHFGSVPCTDIEW